MIIVPETLHYLDYFAGGVPAGTIFFSQVQSLREAVRAQGEPAEISETVVEVCLIGLVGYFEAFVKDHFASLINICPSLLQNLKAKNRPLDVDALEIALDPLSSSRLGFLVAERYDFGSARAINSLYGDLVARSLFSADEANRFARLLDDRNLLVHHGGIFTSRYAGQRFAQRDLGGRVFYDSLVVDSATFCDAADFLESIAEKATTSTRTALASFMTQRGIEPSSELQKAIDGLVWKI